uniref:Complement component C7 n=1 Tax=Sphyrna zygaena TaxID=195335 RepID=A0A146GE93_SPHZY|nr:complement C7 [Sphyrna zygaena]
MMKLLLLVSMATALAHGQYSAVHCQWGQFSPWSECEGCNNTQTRWRSVAVYTQFGGQQCTGPRFEIRSCVSARGCPLDQGCGDQFRCASGQCVSRSLVCNGDEDCEGDGADEANCESRKMACDIDKIPPQAELTGKGFDVIKGEFRGLVINTKSFGGTCRKVFSGDNRDFYRLPQNILQYTFQVQAKNDFKFRMHQSSWSYLKDTKGEYAELGKGIFSSYSSKNDKFTTKNNQVSKEQIYLTVENEVEVAQFISNRPDQLPLPSSFHQELLQLPAVYERGAYRRLIELYGTHYLRQASLGGKYNMLFMVDKDKMRKSVISNEDMSKCSQTSINLFIVKYNKDKCEEYRQALHTAMGDSSGQARGLSFTVGGRAAFVAALSLIDMRNAQANTEVYQRWAGSVKENPVIINQKLAPLPELVKGVPCAGVKRHYLQRAIEDYISEVDPCRCRPCQNSGQTVVVGSGCQCFCKPYTFGIACERGVLAQDPESGSGIDGSWTCWTGWSSCTNRRRERSRRCENPPPSRGGRECVGPRVQSDKCEDGEMEYLRQLEPHCFERENVPTRSCLAPPQLENAFVQDLKAVYPVGSYAVYRCHAGYFISESDGTLRCGENLQWESSNLQCRRTVCPPPQLHRDITVSPEQPSYRIGEVVSLSCPPGSTLEGHSEVTCDSSLQWSQDLNTIRCNTDAVTTRVPDALRCRPWEKIKNGICACKMPYECSSSLPVCAVKPSGQVFPLTLCKFLALECLGRRFEMTSESDCPSSSPAVRECGSCSPWERCDDQQGRCVCKVSEQECTHGGIRFCALVEGSEVGETVSECQAGVWRCQGKPYTILTAHPCSHQSAAPSEYDMVG